MNIIKMFRGIKMAQQLLESGGAAGFSPPTGASRAGCAAEAGSSRRSHRDYDLVLRLRPDLCFCGPLDLTPQLSRPRTQAPGVRCWPLARHRGGVGAVLDVGWSTGRPSSVAPPCSSTTVAMACGSSLPIPELGYT